MFCFGIQVDCLICYRPINLVILKLENTSDAQRLLVNYLRLVDADFGVPLSSKTNLDEYATKLLQNGKVIVAVEDNQIIALVGCYCNDLVHRIAYIPILSTSLYARGRGLAKSMVELALLECQRVGMNSVKVDSINPVAIRVYQKVGFQIVDEDMIADTRRVFLEYQIKN